QAAALRQGLAALNDEFMLFSQVRGRGLMLGAVLNQAHAGQVGTILDHAAAHGVLTLQAGPDVLRFVPSLNITDQEMGEGLRRLRAALQDYVGKR
ncbi:aminotransferase class III-fold pyridoxal phosphate-dependent enzyme, partial [Xanthomonas translucens]